ncbi:MAG: hypothetical protein AB1414_15665 [bacterium]
MMAKCPICSSRKGKRKCLIKESPICTPCCGEIRKEETCRGCPFYKELSLKRKYNEVPSYTPRQMEASFELQKYSNAIEGAICAFDQQTNQRMNDTIPIRVIELLLDKYHFHDESLVFDNDLLERAFHYVNKAIEMDLSKMPTDKLVKVLAVIHFVAKRRSKGGREYLAFIKQYVGIRAAPGVRIMVGLGPRM